MSNALTLGIDRLVRELNVATKLCYTPVNVIFHGANYVDMFAYESKGMYTQALRLTKNADGSLAKHEPINFALGERFKQRSLVEAVGDYAIAFTSPTISNTNSTDAARREAVTLIPVVAETDFGYASVPRAFCAYPQSEYVSIVDSVKRNPAPYSVAYKLLNKPTTNTK